MKKISKEISQILEERTVAKIKCKFLILFAVAALAVLLYPPPASAASINLGTAANFGVLAAASISNTGSTVIAGDMGVSPGTTVTGFSTIDGGPGIVNGTIYQGGAVATQAQSDLTTAYKAAVGLVSTSSLTGQDLGGLTLTPGVYSFSSTAGLGVTGSGLILTLNFEGLSNQSIIFQIGSTLTTASSSSVIVENGNSTDNVYWQVGSSATLGTGTAFVGNILANTSITLNTGATILDGRAMAGAVAPSGAVTLDGNTIDLPSSPVPVPATMLLLGPGLAGLAALRKRLKFKK